MGILGPDQFDAEMDFDIGKKYQVMGLGTACPTIFDEDTDMVAVCRNIARFFKNESCGQCTPCREGSGVDVSTALPHRTRRRRPARTSTCCWSSPESQGIMPGTTICGLADGNNWAVRTIVNKYRDEFETRLRRSSTVSLRRSPPSVDQLRSPNGQQPFHLPLLPPLHFILPPNRQCHYP